MLFFARKIQASVLNQRAEILEVVNLSLILIKIVTNDFMQSNYFSFVGKREP